MRILIFCIVSILGFHLVYGQAKNCYQCLNCGCDDPFQKDFFGVSQGSSASGWCVKSKRTEKGKVTITRTSALLPVKESYCEETTTSSFKTKTCYCNGDLCNDAVIPKLSSIFIICFVIRSLMNIYQHTFN